MADPRPPWKCDLCGSDKRPRGCKWTDVPDPGPLPLSRPPVERPPKKSVARFLGH